MPTDILFNFYEILVENIFGSMGLAIIGVGFVITLILFITKTSNVFLLYWLLFYGVIMFTFYFGTLGLVLFATFSFIMMIFNIVKTYSRQD